jgi:retinoid hydroxylase
MTANTPNTSPTDPTELPLPPGRKGLPLIGETLQMVVEGKSFLEKRQRLYGDVFRTHIFGRPMIYLLGPEANRWLLMNEGREVEVSWPPTVERLLGPGSLSNLHGDEHRARRKLLAPSFSQTEMRAFVGTIEEIARTHLERAAASSKPVVAVDVMRALAFEVAARLVLGGTDADLPALRRAFEDFVGGLFTPIRWPLPFTSFRKAVLARTTLNKLLDRIIDTRLADGKTHCDVLASLLTVRDESGNALTREVIRDELTTLLFAGHETTVNVMTNAVILLAKNASVAARGRQEVEKLPLDEPLTIETLRQIPYIQRIIQETMRVLPPVGGVFRQALRDTSFGGHRIPKGSVIACSILATHQDEKIYEYPDRFDPDRFDREKSNEKKDFAFLPFGGGLRICIGQHLAMVEMQIVLTHLLRSYDWSLVPNQDLTYRAIPTPLPKSGGLISFRKR